MVESIDTVVIRTDRANSALPKNQMVVGGTVTLYDETMECEAILRHGKYHEWVAEILPETIRCLPEDHWDRLDGHH